MNDLLKEFSIDFLQKSPEVPEESHDKLLKDEPLKVSLQGFLKEFPEEFMNDLLEEFQVGPSE